MHRFTIACFVLIGCSSAAPKDDPIQDLRKARADADAGAVDDTASKVEDTSSTASASTSSSSTVDTSTQTTDAGTTDAEASTPPCLLGDGLYCGGNGVPGAANELYRCTNGVPVLEQTCTGQCAKMPDGINDVCDCALGDGLYCGGNGVNGDTDKLYRCSGGTVTLEQACDNGCEKKPDGVNDVCS